MCLDFSVTTVSVNPACFCDPDVLNFVCIILFSQVVMDFKMPGKVFTAAMSPIATTHMLIATGSADVQVRLCDIASGAFTHSLSGHHG